VIARAPAPRALPGQWTKLGLPAGTTVTGYGPSAWVSPGVSHAGYFVWLIRFSNATQAYEFATMGENGATSTSAGVFGTASWGALYGLTSLVGSGARPLLVFEGAQGTTSGDPYNSPCIYGDSATSSGPWALQSWSLTNKCDGAGPSAIGYMNGVVAAAWEDLGTLKYRIGVSPTIPATGADNVISLPGRASAEIAGIVADVGSDANSDGGDTYVGWGQNSGTTAANGFYVKDVAANGPITKAPGSGVNSLPKIVGWVQIPMVATPAGVFLAYPSNQSAPNLLLWKVRSTTPLVVPGSSGVFAPQLATGPGGRLWISWDTSSYGIAVVRTNKADTKFGPVETYPTPCGFVPSAALGAAGTFGRLDIVIKCQSKTTGFPQEVYATQVLVPLTLSPTSVVIKNTQQDTVTFRVTDAGDAVAGATVAVDGKTAATNVSGVASFTFAKGAKTGTYQVTASALDYLTVYGSLKIET
jgi:hypothetical protein